MSVEWVQEVTTERGGWHCAVAFGCWMRVRPGKLVLPTDNEPCDDRPHGWFYSVHKDGKRVAGNWCKTREEAQTAAELAAQGQP